MNISCSHAQSFRGVKCLAPVPCRHILKCLKVHRIALLFPNLTQDNVTHSLSTPRLARDGQRRQRAYDPIVTGQVRRGHLRTPAGNSAGPLASRPGVSLGLLSVGSGAGLETAPARGADWQSGRRRPGNGSGFSRGRDPSEEAAAAARAARGERRERRAAAAGAEAAHGRSSARPHELRRGGCLRVPGPAWRLLSGLAGAGREPPGLSVPSRCECSPLASKVWSRQRQTPALSSSRCPDPRAAPASCPRCSAIRDVREASEPWGRLQPKGSFSFWSFPPSSSSAPS